MTFITEGKLCYLFTWYHFQSYSFWNPGIYGSTTWKKWKVQVLVAHHVLLFVTPWTVAHQTPLSMGFSGQEYWSGVPFPPPGDLPDPGIELASLSSPALAGGFFTTGSIWEAAFWEHATITRWNFPSTFGQCKPLHTAFCIWTVCLISSLILTIVLSFSLQEGK